MSDEPCTTERGPFGLAGYLKFHSLTLKEIEATLVRHRPQVACVVGSVACGLAYPDSDLDIDLMVSELGDAGATAFQTRLGATVRLDVSVESVQGFSNAISLVQRADPAVPSSIPHALLQPGSWLHRILIGVPVVGVDCLEAFRHAVEVSNFRTLCIRRCLEEAERELRRTEKALAQGQLRRAHLAQRRACDALADANTYVVSPGMVSLKWRTEIVGRLLPAFERHFNYTHFELWGTTTRSYEDALRDNAVALHAQLTGLRATAMHVT